MKINNAALSLIAASALGMLALSAARADINPVAPGTPTITSTAGGFAYTYPIVLSGTETLVSGDYFTFFDVNGLIAGSGVAPLSSGWTASSALIGPIAVGTLSSSPTMDSPFVPNVTFTYSGPTVVGSPTPLGSFGFSSIYGLGTTLEAFSAIANKSGSNTVNSNATSYFGPTAVPEPATTVPFVIGGLALLGLVVRKTRRASSVAA